MGTNVAARTEVVGMRRVFARRLGTFRLGDGTPAARVRTDWVLIDDRGALTRVPAVFGEMFGAGDGTISIGRLPLPATPPEAVRRAFEVRPQELDPMGHANNAVYLDWLEETVRLAGGDDDVGRTPRRYRLEYALAAEPGAILESAAWRQAAGWSFRLTEGASGSDLFRAALDVGQTGSGMEDGG
jgi:acyl-CoA thioesterase FadM